MNRDKKKKQELFLDWILKHQEDNTCILFKKTYPELEISTELNEFLRKYKSNTVYIMMNLENNIWQPQYIGKSKNVKKRWMDHINELKNVYLNINNRKSNWRERLIKIKIPINLLCVEEESIKTPPIPGFPITIGAIESQLISLASDCYDSPLLNYEGVKR